MNVSRFASLLFAVFLPATALEACSDDAAETGGGGATTDELAFHGEIKPDPKIPIEPQSGSRHK